MRKRLNMSNRLLDEICKNHCNIMIILLVFVIGIHIQFVDGCRSTISRFGFDLPKFDTNQNKYNGRAFITKGIVF